MSILSLYSSGISVFTFVLFKWHCGKWILSSLLLSNSVTKSAWKNNVLFIGLRCGQHSDIISSCQKTALKTVYFFKILVV